MMESGESKHNMQGRLQELLDCILDKSYSDAQQQEFIRLMDENPQWASEVVEQLRTHSLLEWQSDKWQGDQWVGKKLAAPATAAILPMELPNEGPHTPHQAFSSAESLPHKLLSMVAKRRWLWAAAAILVAAGVALGWHHIQQANQAQLALAEVVESDLVQWSDNSTARIGSRAYCGRKTGNDVGAYDACGFGRVPPCGSADQPRCRLFLTCW